MWCSYLQGYGVCCALFNIMHACIGTYQHAAGGGGAGAARCALYGDPGVGQTRSGGWLWALDHHAALLCFRLLFGVPAPLCPSRPVRWCQRQPAACMSAGGFFAWSAVFVCGVQAPTRCRLAGRLQSANLRFWEGAAHPCTPAYHMRAWRAWQAVRVGLAWSAPASCSVCGGITYLPIYFGLWSMYGRTIQLYPPASWLDLDQAFWWAFCPAGWRRTPCTQSV